MTHQPSSNQHLIPQLATFDPALIIFDKDGTLIDFHAMWGAWATELARRLETAAGQPLANALFTAIDFDPATGQIAPHYIGAQRTFGLLQPVGKIVQLFGGGR